MNSFWFYAAIFFVIGFLYAGFCYWLKIQRAKVLGKYGEYLIAQKLKNLQKRGIPSGKILQNLYIPKNNGEYSEIDLVFITDRGFFVIESKNYSGRIYGNENSRYWTAQLSHSKSRFYNPIRQNRAHIHHLQQFLGTPIKMFSLIVFSERCSLKKIHVVSENVSVLQRNNLKKIILRIYQQNSADLPPEKIQELYDQLLPLTQVSKEIKRQHVENVKNAKGLDKK